MNARYDIQSNEDGTFIVREAASGEWMRIAAFIPGEYTAEDESLLGNAHGLADALTALLHEHDRVDDGHGECANSFVARGVLRDAGRRP